MTTDVSIRAAKLAKYGEPCFDTGHWPASVGQCSLTYLGRVLVSKRKRTKRKAKKEAASINFQNLLFLTFLSKISVL